jgi:hypothetical protein
LILAGQVTEQCILLHRPRRLRAPVPRRHPDRSVAHIDADLGAAALKMMEQDMSAEITSAADCLS